MERSAIRGGRCRVATPFPHCASLHAGYRSYEPDVYGVRSARFLRAL
jgi:hypothetical protein